ncbi:MAG: hypothetical protein NT027_05140 [Proteobacteria bacterium]|nr:hypothetical protein [Pseudomonadota bacterium]
MTSVLIFAVTGCKTTNSSQALSTNANRSQNSKEQSLMCRMTAKQSKPFLVYKIGYSDSVITSLTYSSFPDSSSEIPAKSGALESFVGGSVKKSKSKIRFLDNVDGDAGTINLSSKNGKITGRITFTNSGPEGLEGDGRGYNLACESIGAEPSLPADSNDVSLGESQQIDIDLKCEQSAKSWSLAKKRNQKSHDGVDNRQFIRLLIQGKTDSSGEKGSGLLNISDQRVSDPSQTLNYLSMSAFDPARTANFNAQKGELYIESIDDGDSGVMTLNKSGQKWRGSMNFPEGSAKGWFYGEGESVEFDCK